MKKKARRKNVSLPHPQVYRPFVLAVLVRYRKRTKPDTWSMMPGKVLRIWARRPRLMYTLAHARTAVNTYAAIVTSLRIEIEHTFGARMDQEKIPDAKASREEVCTLIRRHILDESDLLPLRQHMYQSLGVLGKSHQIRCDVSVWEVIRWLEKTEQGFLSLQISIHHQAYSDAAMYTQH